MLVIHILRGVSCHILRQSTVDIAQQLEGRKRVSVPFLLSELYRIREKEARLEMGEIGMYSLMKKLRSD